jgi:mono/diheme cytochrome c family protein
MWGGVCLALAGSAAWPQNSRSAAPKDATFDSAVAPVLSETCAMCHNPQTASGGLNVGELGTADSLASHREQWEKILRRLKAGEMPPADIPKPAGLPQMVAWLEQQFAALDKTTPIDPGRVTARHLNRVEYQNTIRDLLGVDFQATKDFPVDDSGDGFDNIGDVLSVSPLLSERYIAAAERISARALGLIALPATPIKASYADDDNYKEVVPFNGTNGAAKRVSPNAIEATHRVIFDGEYTIQAGLAGGRPDPAKPVTLALWMDGEILKTKEISMATPQGKFFAPYEVVETKAVLPEGVHTFRLSYLNDPEGDAMTKADALNAKKNKYIQLIGFVGPVKPTEEPASRKKILVCDPNTGAACIEKIASTFATRAWRRPVTKAEVATLTNLVVSARKDGATTDQALQEMIEAVLASPNFLFHIEHDPPAAIGKPHPISGVELASRLSYFIWSSLPDDELLNAGVSGALLKPDVLNAQIKRMIEDPRASALADNFAGQWLEIRNLDSIKPDPDRFPDWGPELKEAARTETRLFFDSILSENKPISEFLNARYTFLNEPLAKFYGIEGVQGPQFRRVDLTTEQRGGILSQASVLAVSSYPSRTSVVLRGKYILENVLGTPPPPPPPDVPKLDENSVGTLLSLRQQMENHRANAVCASCHSKMDPLGFALEHYDAIGKWRESDGKFPIDSTGTLPDGQTFDGPAAMRQALAGKLPAFAQCLIEKMLVYSLGRGLGPADQRTIDQIQRNWSAQGYRFQTLIYEVARSAPFQSRRGEAGGEKPVKEVAQK